MVEAAFPNTGNTTWNLHPEPGMSIRDWFAGQALASGLVRFADQEPDWALEAMAAYEIADAMLALRAKATPVIASMEEDRG